MKQEHRVTAVWKTAALQVGESILLRAYLQISRVIDKCIAKTDWIPGSRVYAAYNNFSWFSSGLINDDMYWFLHHKSNGSLAQIGL